MMKYGSGFIEFPWNIILFYRERNIVRTKKKKKIEIYKILKSKDLFLSFNNNLITYSFFFSMSNQN